MAESTAVIRLTINGEPREVPAPATVASMLEQLGVGTRHTAVERNGVIVSGERFVETDLADGDVLEVVTLVGGG